MEHSTAAHGPNDAARLGKSLDSALSETASSASSSGSYWRAAEGARETLDRARGLAHEAVDRLASGATGLVDRIEGRGRGLGEMPLRAWNNSRSAIVSHPVSTVALAVMAGYLVARLLDLRRP